MRLIICLAFIAVCLAVAASKACKSEDDCGEGECCASSSNSNLLKGRCFKLGRSRAKCNPPAAKMDYYGGKFMKYCPCQDGMECDTGRSRNGFGRCKLLATEKPDEPNPDEPEEPEEKPEEPEEKPEEPVEVPEEPVVNPDEPEAGPGGEKPRDDDCADWELPC